MKRLLSKAILYIYNQWHELNEIRLGIIQLRPCVDCGKKQMFRIIKDENGEYPCVCTKCIELEYSEAPPMENDLLQIPVDDPN